MWWRKKEYLESFYRLLIRQLCRLLYRPRYEGFEHIPETGAVILISNHVSYMDGLLIASACKRKVRFVIDSDIYQLPLVHHVMELNRAIPITASKQSVINALETISEGLKTGDAICIFPEGQLTYTGSLSRFKTGIEAIIKRDPVPVYPIAISGLWGSILSRKFRGSWKRLIPKNPLRPVKLLCGKAINPEQVSVNFLQQAVLHLKYQQ